MSALLRLRQVANLVNLSTLLGLALARAGHATLHRGPDGLILAKDYAGFLPRRTAVTIGNVVLLRVSDSYLEAHPALLAHEARHSTQWACCIGPLGFLPGYFVACAWSWWHTGDPALRNVFEVRAGLVDGGYVRGPQER